MAPTVTRLILSFALLVAAPTLFFVGLFFCFEVLEMYHNDGAVFLVNTIGAVSMLGLGWWGSFFRWPAAATRWNWGW